MSFSCHCNKEQVISGKQAASAQLKCEVGSGEQKRTHMCLHDSFFIGREVLCFDLSDVVSKELIRSTDVEAHT